MANKIASRIAGTGSFFPETVLTSLESEKKIQRPAGWIQERTGILERRIVKDGEQNSDLASAAAKNALASAGVSAEDVDLILGCTNSPDRWMPGLAHNVQSKIGALNAAAFDILDACTGWLVGLATADAFVKSGSFKCVLVVGSEAMSRFLNWEDQTTCILFGDGAGAAIVIPTTVGSGKGEILSSLLRSDGRHGDYLEIPGTGSMRPASQSVLDNKLHYVRMDGEKIFTSAIRKMAEVSEELLSQQNLTIEQIDWLVPHQANAWIIKLVGERLNIDPAKVAVNIEKYGNTTAATIPTCLDQFVKNKKIQPGNLVLMTAFGAGLSWAGALVRW